ncbi:MAG: hypothetical protein Q9201_007818 [Fulgogasparrea decipioides]
MGWPPFKPVNDTIAWVGARLFDFELGMELTRIAQEMRRDLIVANWASPAAKDPDSFTVVLRDVFNVDLIDRCVPVADDEDAPVMLVSTRLDHTFAIGSRGMLERRYGRPGKLGKARGIAMRRLRRAAAAMGGEISADNVWMPTGAGWIEPEPQLDIAIRFN